MNAGFFKSLKGSGLRRREAGFYAAFGEDPAAPSGLHQQEFDATFVVVIVNAVADGGGLPASCRKRRQHFC